MSNTTGITIQQLILGYWTFTFSTLDRSLALVGGVVEGFHIIPVSLFPSCSTNSHVGLHLLLIVHSGLCIYVLCIFSAISGSFLFWRSNQPYQMSGPSREQLDSR